MTPDESIAGVLGGGGIERLWDVHTGLMGTISALRPLPDRQPVHPHAAEMRLSFICCVGLILL